MKRSYSFNRGGDPLRRTSISLHQELWGELLSIAAREHLVAWQLIKRIEIDMLKEGERNLSGFVRLWLVRNLKQRLERALEREKLLLRRSNEILEQIAENMEQSP